MVEVGVGAEPRRLGCVVLPQPGCWFIKLDACWVGSFHGEPPRSLAEAQAFAMQREGMATSQGPKKPAI